MSNTEILQKKLQIMIIKTALILCAGYGKRLAPITNDIPKPLLNVKNLIIPLDLKVSPFN